MFDYVFRLLGLTPVAKAIVQITAPIMAETTNQPIVAYCHKLTLYFLI